MLYKLKNNTLLIGSMAYLASNILTAVIPFVLLPILTRYLSPEEYGEVAMFQVLLGAFTAFIGLSMQGAASRKFFDGGHEKGDLEEFIGSCMQILFLTTSLAMIVLLGISGKVSNWTGLEQRWIFLAAPVTAASIIVQVRLGQWRVLPRYCGHF
ncbi:MAG: oligosaccharide flippase family protein [Marinobacter sp.]|nr:oligosaccharide flippase family protein [Marinobacter sp.]